MSPKKQPLVADARNGLNRLRQEILSELKPEVTTYKDKFLIIAHRVVDEASSSAKTNPNP